MAEPTKAEQKFLHLVAAEYKRDGKISPIEQKVLNALRKEFAKPGESTIEDVQAVLSHVLAVEDAKGQAGLKARDDAWNDYGKAVAQAQPAGDELIKRVNKFYDYGSPSLLESKATNDARTNARAAMEAARAQFHAENEKAQEKMQNGSRVDAQTVDAVQHLQDDILEIKIPKLRLLAEASGLKHAKKESGRQ